MLQRNSTQLTCLSARADSAKRTAAVLGLGVGGVYEYVGSAGIRHVVPSVVSAFGGDVLRVSLQGSSAALNSSQYWRCVFVGLMCLRWPQFWMLTVLHVSCLVS